MYINVEPDLITDPVAAKAVVESGKAFAVVSDRDTERLLFQGTDGHEIPVLHGVVATHKGWIPLAAATRGNPKDLVVLNGQAKTREDVECLDCPAYLDYSLTGSCNGGCPSQNAEERAKRGLPESGEVRRGDYKHVKSSWFVLKPFTEPKDGADAVDMVEAFEGRSQVSKLAAETKAIRKKDCSGCMFLGHGCQGMTRWMKSRVTESCNVTLEQVTVHALARIEQRYGSLAAFRDLAAYCGRERVMKLPGLRARKAMVAYPASPGHVHVVSTVWPHKHLGIHKVADLNLVVPYKATVSNHTLAAAFLISEKLQTQRGQMDYERVAGHDNRVLGIELGIDDVELLSASSSGIWRTTWGRGRIAGFGKRLSLIQPTALGRQVRAQPGTGRFGPLFEDIRGSRGPGNCQTCWGPIHRLHPDARNYEKQENGQGARCSQHRDSPATEPASPPDRFRNRKLELNQ